MGYMKVLLNEWGMRRLVHYIAMIVLFILAISPVLSVLAAYTPSVDQPWTRDYSHQSNDLQQKINALGTTANASVMMPVLFGIEVKDISPNFGDPRDVNRLHLGEDIMAVKGTPIVSPTPAVVLRTGTGTSSGNYVYTANPGGETFVYMHLNNIGEGVVSGLVLGQGSLIGYVGNTGNASGGAAHLHFEIHNSSDTPTDPFPRLTGEFSLQEKISFLSTILTQTSDSATLSQLLVTNFPSTFIKALDAGISLPQPIINAITSIPTTPTTLPINVYTPILRDDLAIGSSGTKVIELQNYLIQAATGVAATRLASAGATGYFGEITQAALIEYQIAMGISPSIGYYGAITRAFITAHPSGDLPSPVITTIPTSNTKVIFTRNLYRGISGEDVRALQKLLNTNGYIVASSGFGSIGNETIYFGSATEAAMIKFQIAHNIFPTAGYVGTLTRAVLVTL
jgi:peptidoglycan hydrolase-like protein with peptidoglycan-binding domain